MFVLADAWSAVGAIAAVVAALAALLTVLYARSTVSEARHARHESHRDHLEETGAQRRLLEASAAAHREEMEDRRSELEAERKLQRLAQLERIAQTVFDVITIAREEHLEPSPKIVEPMPFRAQLISSALARLRVSVAMLEAIGGAHLEEVSKLADMPYGIGNSPMEIVNAGIDALRAIEWALRAESREAATT